MNRQPNLASVQPLAIEWPTWLVIISLYSGWLATLAWYSHAPAFGPLILLVVLGAWYMSLQHELVHNHPTQNVKLNRALGLLPMAVWYPFDVYRDSHLAHHRDELLTFPGIDPESNYTEPADYAQSSALWRFLLNAQRTSVGRFFITPAFSIANLLQSLMQLENWRSAAFRTTWLQHLALLAAMLWAIEHFTGMSAWLYVSISYFMLSVAFMRSFYEHRPAANPMHRIVINEAGWPWRLLYLNNNFHAVHHERPGLPWYAIPGVYWQERERYLTGNGHFFFQGYMRLFASHAVKPIDSAQQITRL
jgi:fatty acid desaturase